MMEPSQAGAQQLFNQTDYSGSSIGSWYGDNWYQLGTGFSGTLQTLTVKCYTSGGNFPSLLSLPQYYGSVTLQEFSDSGYSNQTNNYPLGQQCTSTSAGVTFSALTITLFSNRYYRLYTYEALQNASVTLLGTYSIGLAMYNGFSYGIGRVESYYTFYPYLVSNAGPSPSTYGAPSTVSPFGSTSEPINTATGNYYTSHADVVAPGKGLSFSFTRYYNSLDAYTGPFGAGWTHSFNIFLTANSDGSVTATEADGHQDTFTSGGGGTFSPATPGVFDMLTQNLSGTFTLTRKNQTQFNFTSAGVLRSIADRNGNTQTLNYDGSGNLTSIVDASGRTFTFAHDGNGHITKLSDPIGRSWQYSYDANGNLISVLDAAGGIIQYTYDSNHRMLSAIDPRGVTFLQNTFDSQGRVATQTNGRGFVTTLAYNSPTAGTTAFTDPLGNATQHVYDSSLRLIEVINAKGGTVSYTYDANNDRTSVTNQNGNTLNLAYDSRGNATGVTDPLGDTKAFTYDSMNDLLTSTNAKGAVTKFSYDTRGNPIGIRDAAGNTTSLVYSSAGLLTSKTDARGNTTSYAYDSAGDLTKVTNPLTHATSFTYDGIGRLLTATDPNGHTASVSYDALNRIVKTTDPLSDSTQFAYDGIGNLLKITDANAKATVYAYDATNNLASVTDALGNITNYSYDANNNRTAFKNAKGNVTAYSFDALNRLAQITDPLTFSSSYAYDDVGNAISTTDANGKTNQYTYDVLNRLIKGSFADGSSVTYAYDKDGNRTSMTDLHGTTAYSYDVLDRVLSVTSPNSAVVDYAYDALGNRTSLTYPDGRTIQYQYDPLSRLDQVTDWASKATHYSYDPAGNLAGFAYPNGASSSYSYNAANRLLQIVNASGSQVLSSFTYALDNVGNRLQVTSSASGVTKYGYDALYRLTSWTVPSGQVTQYGYDPVGNRLSMVSSAGTTSYTYDAADRMLLAGTTSYGYDHNGNQISKTTGITTVDYTYDPLNRLTAVTGGGINSQYQYDGDGNRVTQTVPVGTYQYLNDTAMGLTVVLNEAGPDGNIDYLFGLSMISETSSAFQYFYQSDGLGSAASLTDATGALKASYSYDPWGKLLVPIDPLGNKNKYKFTGEALDPATGLYYLRARYYDPSGARFTARDRLLGFAYVPQSLNRYQYALGNPARYSDPRGLSATDEEAEGQTLSRDSLSASISTSGGGFAKGVVNCIFDFLTGGCIAGFVTSKLEDFLIDITVRDQQGVSDLKLLLEPSFEHPSSETVSASNYIIDTVEPKFFNAIGGFLSHFHLPGL